MEISREIILNSFLVETGEGLAQMEEAILELESHPEDLELIQTIFRVVHTIKGNASILELPKLQSFAHSTENLLDELRSQKLSVTSRVVNLLFSSLDVLREMIAAVKEGRDEINARSRTVLNKISKCLAESSESGNDIRREEDAPAATTVLSKTPLSTDWDSLRTVRVEISKLDRLLDLTGEIAIARGRIATLLENPEQADFDQLRETSSLADTLYTELQETVLKSRMVSMGPLFRQFVRTVRDVAKSHGKLARLVIEGEDVEVDTSVIEHLKDPLLHMIRNAIDHGIELPSVRKKQGKPPSGTLTVRAVHQGACIVIEVSDDGAGLDRERVAEVARKRGLALEPEKMPERDLFQLIFEPGFSTAGSVSDLSGRGVGMDVVRRNVQALRGNVSISSARGAGSTVHIRLPLTLAIIDGFGVGVGDESYVIPLDQVLECVELPVEARDSEYRTGVMELRGEPVPYLQLRDHFQLHGTRAARQNVVVVQHDGRRAGLAVDTLYGATQTVIKPLAHLFKNVAGVSGSAILGNGRVALILDVPALLRGFALNEVDAA
jgi:two-component system, chemotaxis family, sensor kinase CheA